MNLKPITHDITESEIRLLAKWRKSVQKTWGEKFVVTIEGTRKWINSIIDNEEKLLFFVYSGNKPIGHVGYDFITKNYVFIGNIIRGEGKSKGEMGKAVKYLIFIAKKFYSDVVFLKVLKTNTHAISFYKKIGFRVDKKMGKYLIMIYGRGTCPSSFYMRLDSRNVLHPFHL